MATVVYGYRRKLKVVKPLGVTTCSNCGHRVEMSLAKESGYFHIYWIPICPISGWKIKLCPICGMSEKLTGAEYKKIKKSVL